VALELLERAGDNVSDDIWHRVVQLVTNNENMQAGVVGELWVRGVSVWGGPPARRPWTPLRGGPGCVALHEVWLRRAGCWALGAGRWARAAARWSITLPCTCPACGVYPSPAQPSPARSPPPPPPPLQEYAARNVVDVLQRGAAHESLVCTAAYILGEFGRTIMAVGGWEGGSQGLGLAGAGRAGRCMRLWPGSVWAWVEVRRWLLGPCLASGRSARRACPSGVAGAAGPALASAQLWSARAQLRPLAPAAQAAAEALCA
jgi:hypothetical protein